MRIPVHARRMFAFVLMIYIICSVLFAPLSLASSAEIPNPTVPGNANEYDAKHPENLQPDQIAAHSYLLMEMSSGEILMERDMNEIMFPASTTKIMTCLLALEYIAANRQADESIGTALNRRVTVSHSALNIEEGSSRVGFRPGDTVSLRDALYGMMLESGNEAANVIAEYVSGSQEAFVEFMNEQARLYDMTDTHFMNPHGLHNIDHYTTAADMAKLARIAMSNSVFRQIVSSVTYTAGNIGNRGDINMRNSNRLIDPSDERFYLPYAIGVKTGTHSQSAYTLVAVAQRNGFDLLVVLMYTGQYSRWTDARRLFDYGFTQFTSMSFEEIYKTNPITVQSISFATDDMNHGEIELIAEPVDPSVPARITGRVAEVHALVENYRTMLISVAYTRGRQPKAPIYAGEELGIVTFYTPTGEAPKFKLIAPRDVAARSNAPLTLEQIEDLANNGGFSLFPLSWDMVIPSLLITAVAAFLLRFAGRYLRGVGRDARQIPKPKKRGYR